MKNLYNIDTAFFQTYKGEFVTEATFVGFMGCEQLGIKCIKFDIADIATLDIQKNTPVFGGVTAVRTALTHLGIVPPEPIDIPEQLIPYTKRKIEYGTLKHFMKYGNFPLFVKPRKAKLFNGMVVSSPDELSFLSAVDIAAEEQEIMTSSVVNFIAEFRVFVIEGEVVDCRKYIGYWDVMSPNFDFIEKVIENYKGQPIAYAIDFGIEAGTGRTMLIEVNDGYSIGSYGMNFNDYTKLCILRWNQLTS